MGAIGDRYYNATCESFFATLECELLERCRFQVRDPYGVAFMEGGGTMCADATSGWSANAPGLGKSVSSIDHQLKCLTGP